jgi:hypothetical protein
LFDMMSRSIPDMPHVNFLMGIGMLWFFTFFSKSEIDLSNLSFCRLLGATWHANGLCDVHHPSIHPLETRIRLSCGWTTTELPRFHLSGQSEPMMDGWMDGKLSINGFLFNSSSLAQFSVVVSSVTFKKITYLLPTLLQLLKI